MWHKVKPGQRAAIVILLYDHNLKAEGKKTQRNRTDLTSEQNGAKVRNSKVPQMEQSTSAGRTNEIIAKKAEGKARMSTGGNDRVSPFGERLDSHKKLAIKAGVG